MPDPRDEEKLEALLTEVRTLRARLDELHTLAIPRHRWAKIFIRDLESNPYAQYRVHYFGVIYWLVNFPAVALLFFLEPRLWLKLGIFITLIYSIYANFATDYGSMSAAMAAYRGNGLPQVPGEALSPPQNGGGQ
jgi:hypothetical protein